MIWCFSWKRQQSTTLADQLSAYYFVSRYPPGPPEDYTLAEVQVLLEQVQQLIDRIKDLPDVDSTER